MLDQLSQSPIATYAAGQTIIDEGSRPGKLFFLKEGRVEVIRNGTRVALIKTKGSVIGEMSLLLDIPATASVIAQGEAALHVIDDPLEFLKDHPDVNLQVSRMLAYRLDSATRYLVDVKEQLAECSDHVGMVDGVLDAILHRDLKSKVGS
jgi:CRP-like cAMP-binding protein